MRTGTAWPWSPLGLMAGFGYAIKYTAFVMVLFALGFVAAARAALAPRRYRSSLFFSDDCAVDVEELDRGSKPHRAVRQHDLPQSLFPSHRRDGLYQLSCATTTSRTSALCRWK